MADPADEDAAEETLMLVGRGTTVDIAIGFGRRTGASITSPIALAPGLWIEPLSAADGMKLFDACRIERLEFHPLPPDAYALVSEHAEPSWDKSGKLWRAMNYSRLVWPNVMAFEFVAQVEVAEDGSLSRIHPPEVQDGLGRVFMPPGVRAAYPTPQHAETLKQILRSRAAGRRSSRVGLAMWRFSHGQFVFPANFRLSVLVGAIETLVNTQRSAATEQFITRVAGMSVLCLGHRRNGRRWARRVYKVRNTLAHGRRLLHHRRGYSPDAFERAYEKLIAEVEDFVRLVLLAAHTRPDVRRVLNSPKQVALRWPLKPRKARAKPKHTSRP